MKLLEEKIRKLELFRFGLLQDYLTLSKIFKKEGISFSELTYFVKNKVQKEEEYLKEIKRKQKEWQRKAPKCPLCQETLKLRTVVIPKGPQNLFGWESSWFCESLDCAYEHYSEKTPEAQLAKYKLL